uniref:NADH dehydrogenase [ubiquinone] 1 alpha subcomplex assembly factor 3-like n=1 Tax=Phallusia mammillata TaxID=59560 RepID=A0A6F9DMP1_9ASCI|nr:NADH dehydrogenase [ubiquinone] 1 alpha subcomplex assembly factor 3-like [Phallusia mammillata]
MLRSRFINLFKQCRKAPVFVTRRCYGKMDFPEFEELANKTSLDIASEDSDLHHLYLRGYIVGGFKFTHTTVYGPVAILDSAVFGWNVVRPEAITAESLALFHLIHPKLDMVVIGTGDTFHPLPSSVYDEMKSHGVAIEVQRTAHACGIYNLLRTKGSQTIGAALIPITNAQNQNVKVLHQGRSNPKLGSRT